MNEITPSVRSKLIVERAVASVDYDSIPWEDIEKDITEQIEFAIKAERSKWNNGISFFSANFHRIDPAQTMVFLNFIRNQCWKVNLDSDEFWKYLEEITKNIDQKTDIIKFAAAL